MSSLPSGAGRDAHRTEDLDPGLDVQLASKTSHLTLSSAGTEAEGSRTDEENLSLDTIELPETTISAAAVTPGIFSNGQADIEAGGWREETHLSLSTFPPPQAVDAPLRTHLHAGEESCASSDAEAFVSRHDRPPIQFCELPNEVLLHILSFLEVCDLLATSRVRKPPFVLPRFTCRFRYSHCPPTWSLQVIHHRAHTHKRVKTFQDPFCKIGTA